MTCKHLKECGSCTLFTPYPKQIEFKKNFVLENFREFFSGDVEFFSSTPTKYRIRAEFGIWHDKNDIYYTMNSVNGGKIKVHECEKVAEPIVRLMPNLLDKLKKDEILRQKLFGVEFLTTSNEILAILLYHKRLDEEFLCRIKILASDLGIKILARSRGQKLISSELNLMDELCINNKIYKFNISENAFIQPNKSVNEMMISWAKSCVDSGNDLLELYCGHGNFTVPLSVKFKGVLATEISKSSIANALKNCELNNVNNIKFIRLSADELMSAFAKEREFNRLKDIDIFAYDFSHILVDPPRAGLEKSVLNFIKKYKFIIYISCNPQSLKENLKELCLTHEIVRFGAFDQFANTHHLECGVLLKAKNA